ncbi:MAG: hypothetical protein ABIG94_04065 [Pseudomonadota bacterium]
MRPQTSPTVPPGVPNCLKKRRILNQKDLSPDLCRQYGEKFFSLGWWEDALEFFQKGKVTEGLEKVKAHCLETGDAYLLARLSKEHDPEVWMALADRALALEKFHFARRAYELAGDFDKAAMVAGLIAGLGAEPPEA